MWRAYNILKNMRGLAKPCVLYNDRNIRLVGTPILQAERKKLHRIYPAESPDTGTIYKTEK